jgi:hypothetical protein
MSVFSLHEVKFSEPLTNGKDRSKLQTEEGRKDSIQHDSENKSLNCK